MTPNMTPQQKLAILPRFITEAWLESLTEEQADLLMGDGLPVFIAPENTSLLPWPTRSARIHALRPDALVHFLGIDEGIVASTIDGKHTLHFVPTIMGMTRG